jgi:outer membrane protein assembly factor BamA
VYTEFGDLWDSGYTSTKDEVIYNESYVRISAGFGLAFTVPILGRIRLDYAWPIRKKDYDIEGNFCFGADVKF